MPLGQDQITHFNDQTSKANGEWIATYVQKDDEVKKSNPATAKGICLALSIHFLGHYAIGKGDRFVLMLDRLSGELRVALCAEIMARETKIPEKSVQYKSSKEKYKNMSLLNIGLYLTKKLRRHYFRDLYSIRSDRVDREPLPVNGWEVFGASVARVLATAGTGYYLIDMTPDSGPYGHTLAAHVGCGAPLDITFFDANIGVFHFGHTCDWQKFLIWLAYFFYIAGYQQFYTPCKVRIEKYEPGANFKTPPTIVTKAQPAPKHPLAPRQEDFYNDLLDDDSL